MVVVDKDPASCSNFNEIKSTNIDIIWSVDFDSHKLVGSVEHSLQVGKDGVRQVKFDSRDLCIESVTLNGSSESLNFEYGKASVDEFGQTILVQLPEGLKAGEVVKVKLNYSTKADPSALQFMTADQTAGRRAPYLFSQCQAIHARSMLPCMDTPAVKATYSAQVTVPNNLTALMSAVGDKEPATSAASKERKTFSFNQKVPIPSYLIALVVGALESRQISDRCAVWSEPEIVDAAKEEFIEAEKMIQAAESLVGPYVWGRYDILVLPPSFPFGGMENPCLTFVTPTLLAGDRSLANVIAHEISHSWTGNLVTNATWDDFWLNEGFTTFLERKVTAKLMHESNQEHSLEVYRHSLAIEGWASMKNTVEEQFKEGTPDHRHTALVWDTTGTDPDDAFSCMPYEKGHTFLFYLEETVGGPEKFEPWLRQYVDDFKYKCLTSDDWKQHIVRYFKENGGIDLNDKVKWNEWFKKTGMPIYTPKYNRELYVASENLAQEWYSAEHEPSDASFFDKLTTLQRMHFLTTLSNLGGKLSPEKLENMRQLYGMDKIKNCDVRNKWILFALKQHAEFVIPLALDFVTEQGRMKYTRPVYRALYEWEEGSRARAIERFEKNRPFMHPMTATMVSKDLQLAA